MNYYLCLMHKRVLRKRKKKVAKINLKKKKKVTKWWDLNLDHLHGSLMSNRYDHEQLLAVG